MADNTQLNLGTGGDVIATDDIGGVKHQRVKVEFGSDGSASDVSSSNPLPVDVITMPANATASGSITANGQSVSITPPAGVSTTGLQITGTWTGQIDFEVTIDGTNWVTVYATNNQGSSTNATTANGVFIMPAAGVASLRAKSTSWTSGTASVGFNANIGAAGTSFALPTGDNNVGRVKITDGTDVATVTAGGLLQVDASGVAVPVTDNAGSLTVDNAALSVTGGGVEASALRVTIANDSTGVVSVDDNGSTISIDDGAGSITVDGTVTASNTAGDVAHDTGDSGNPVKIGGKAANALPTAVANNDRTNMITDLWGRQLTSHIDPAMQVHKSFNATSTQTGADVWTPTSGKKIAITSIVIGVYGTTAGRIILWFGDNADTTYTAGTDQLVLAFSAAPSSTSKPGLVFCPAVPVFCTTADRELHITTDAAVSIDIAIEGYEW